MNNDKWIEVCFYLSKKIKTEITESEFEKNVLQALSVLGWKEHLDDIQTRKSLHIGASRKITPDFIINSTEKKNLFVIEIKQPFLPLTTTFQQQLFSYMRQLKLEYGILIGQAIQIFYDGDLTQNDDPILLETIQIQKEDSKGNDFVKLFSKENFSFDSLKTFTLNSLKKINRRTDQKILTQKIVSEDYRQKVLTLIKQDFLNEYDAELIDNALKEITLNISKNIKEVEIPSIPAKIRGIKKSAIKKPKDNTRFRINDGKPLAKNRFVLEFIRAYLKKKPTDFLSLKKVFPNEFQGSTGVINELEFVEKKYANKTKRHFVGDNDILESSDGVKFVVTTEWSINTVHNIVGLAQKEGFQIEEV